MKRLAISLATRGRADRLVQTVNKAVSNWTNADTVMYVQIDDDDQPSIDVANKAGWATGFDGPVMANVAPREDTVAAKWNRILKVPAAVYMYHADDDPYTTKGYDQLVLDAADRFPDGIGTVFGHLANLSFSCTYAATAKYVAKMGYLLPDYFPYWFCDHWTDDVARITGRIAFANIQTDQSNPGVTQEMREPGWWATFFDAAYLMRRKQAHDIIDDPDFITPRWQCEILKTHHPLIEVRSRMINASVRAQSKQLEAWAGNQPHNERYTRVKNRAIALIPRLLSDYGMPESEADMFAKALLGKPLERAA